MARGGQRALGRFRVDGDSRGAVVLFFFYGDPDIGNAYVMERPAAQAVGTLR
ncbi:hypothetical protein [Streptomyces sp. NPDC051921]|uniref:hypothetical protein n=1 Tax=Streptomyces sp. NPDC051921 TaxID=3155806 RepID=UPI00342B51A8